MKLIIGCLLVITALTGCSLKASLGNAFKSEKVQAWERNILARDDMQLEYDAMQTYADEHIYFSKEAAAGGRGVGGGGCGCN